MSTLRVSNIEAKADASSPTVNEKIKITNSNGDVLVHVNGETAGVTTVGVNTTGESVRFDSNQNAKFFGDIITNSSVGIGTDIPDHNLHVLQSAGDSVITIESQGNGSHSALEFKRTSSAGDGRGAGSIYVTGDTSASEARMHFGVGHNVNHGEIPRLTIMGNGEVGIGTDNPTTALQIQKNVGDGTGVTLNVENTATSTSYASVFATAGSSAVQMFADAAGNALGTPGAMIRTNTAIPLFFGVNNQEKVRITPESEIRLGYGTTISFPRDNGNTDYSTKIFATNNPDGGYSNTTDQNYWNCLSSKGGCHIVLNSDSAYNSGRNNYDHFTIFQNYWTEQNNAGKRLFSVDNVGGVQLGLCGVTLDRGWGNFPSITVQSNNNFGETNQGEFRIHGYTGTHASWVGGAGGADFSVNLRVDGGQYLGSDRRHKTNIVDNPYGLSSILQLQPRKFNRINSNGDIETDKGDILGFIAQEVLDVIPEAVNYYPDEDIPNENGFCRAYALSDSYIVSTLVNAVKELSAKNDALEARIATLEGS